MSQVLQTTLLVVCLIEHVSLVMRSWIWPLVNQYACLFYTRKLVMLTTLVSQYVYLFFIQGHVSRLAYKNTIFLRDSGDKYSTGSMFLVLFRVPNSVKCCLHFCASSKLGGILQVFLWNIKRIQTNPSGSTRTIYLYT